MTPTSLVPEIAAHAGHSFGELVSWMVEDASCFALKRGSRGGGPSAGRRLRSGADARQLRAAAAPAPRRRACLAPAARLRQLSPRRLRQLGASRFCSRDRRLLSIGGHGDGTWPRRSPPGPASPSTRSKVTGQRETSEIDILDGSASTAGPR